LNLADREYRLENARFTLAPSGRLIAVQVDRSSGNIEIDRLAMKLIWKGSPYPPLPKVRGFDGHFVIPVQFARRPNVVRRRAGSGGAHRGR